MKVTIELVSGPHRNSVVDVSDVQKNIDALQRYLDGKQKSSDFVFMIEVISILRGIQENIAKQKGA
jgi:hypothetical protein